MKRGRDFFITITNSLLALCCNSFLKCTCDHNFACVQESHVCLFLSDSKLQFVDSSKHCSTIKLCRLLLNVPFFTVQYSSYTAPLNCCQILAGLSYLLIIIFYNDKSGFDGFLLRGIFLLWLTLQSKLWCLYFYLFLIPFFAYKTSCFTLFSAFLVPSLWNLFLWGVRNIGCFHVAQILFSRLWHAGTLLTLYGIASELDFFYRSELESGESFFFFFF